MRRGLRSGAVRALPVAGKWPADRMRGAAMARSAQVDGFPLQVNNRSGGRHVDTPSPARTPTMYDCGGSAARTAGPASTFPIRAVAARASTADSTVSDASSTPRFATEPPELFTSNGMLRFAREPAWLPIARWRLDEGLAFAATQARSSPSCPERRARITPLPRPHRLEAQDATLSRWRSPVRIRLGVPTPPRIWRLAPRCRPPRARGRCFNPGSPCGLNSGPRFRPIGRPADPRIHRAWKLAVEAGRTASKLADLFTLREHWRLAP